MSCLTRSGSHWPNGILHFWPENLTPSANVQEKGSEAILWENLPHAWGNRVQWGTPVHVCACTGLLQKLQTSGQPGTPPWRGGPCPQEALVLALQFQEKQVFGNKAGGPGYTSRQCVGGKTDTA